MLQMYIAGIVVAVTAFSLDGVQAGCCWKTEWEAVEGLTMGITKGEEKHIIEGYMGVHYDYDKKLIALDEDLYYDGKEMKAKLIQDYTSGIQYSIARGVCTKQKLPVPMTSNCILKNATKLGDFYMGLGDNKIQLTSYTFTMPQEQEKVTMSVTTDSCIPVGQIMTGSSKEIGDYLASAGFVNLTPGIKDRSVFKIPDICKQPDIKLEDKVHRLSGF
ncbi:hypothetical protein ScPMuIL_004917 [Solemya velum]